MSKSLAPVAVLAALSLAVPSVHAATITENPDAADAQLDNSSSNVVTVDNTNSYEAGIGEFYAPGGRDYVAPFLLPALAPGQTITAASLQTQLFTIAGGSPILGNADLYGLTRLSTSSTVLTSDYYQGPLDPNNTLIQAGFFTPASTVRTDPNTGPFVDTSLSGAAALASFLNTAEAASDGLGDEYVFLRLSYNLSTIPTGNDSYEVLTENAGGANEKPLLTITTGASAVGSSVPEPASLALLAVGGLGILRKRRAR